MLPSQISWHLAWSDLFPLFQNLHTAICATDTLQQVVFAGENVVIRQNLQRVWQQFVEDYAEHQGYVAEVDLVTTAQAIAAQTSYSTINGFHASVSPVIDNLAQPLAESPLLLRGIEAGVLLGTKHFWLWVLLQADATDRPCHSPDEATGNRDRRPRWQVTLMLERQMIADLLGQSASPAIASALLQTMPPEPWGQSISQFWQGFLQITQPVASPSECPTLNRGSTQAGCLLFQPVLDQMPLGMFQANLDGSIVAANLAFCQLTGYTQAELYRLDLQAITASEDFAIALEMIQQSVQYGEQRIFEQRYHRSDGRVVWVEVKLSLVGNPDDENSFLLGFVTDLSDRRQLEAHRLQTLQEIQKRQERETLLNNIAVRIRSSLDLPTMLQRAVVELNQALHTDRVVIYQIFADGSGTCVSEAVHPHHPAMQGQTFGPDCIPPPYLDAYCSGRLWSVDDVARAQLAGCHHSMLANLQVQSMIATGILSMDASLAPDQRQLWGLLAVHQCQSTRQWTADDRHLVEAVANQLAIALEQTKLLNQLTNYTQELEDRVRQRTQSLERSLKFEQFIRNLTECLHRDFNETHLFTTVVQGLVETLAADACLVSLYHPQDNTFEVTFEALSDAIPPQHTVLGQHFALQQLPLPLQQQFLENQTCCCNGSLEDTCFLKLVTATDTNLPWRVTTRICELLRPITDGSQPLGLILVLQLHDRQFDQAEVELVAQTAHYCAIAQRQATLYRQEHEQRVSAEYLRSFLEKSIDVFVEYDPQLRYISINPVGCALLERPPEAIIGKTNQELMRTGSHALDQLIRQAFDTAEKVFVDHELALPQGNRVFESIYAPITDPAGTVQRVIGVCRDITDLKQQWQRLEHQNHQLAETTRLKQEFVATTSHELRTPLTSILGFSNVLLQEFFGELNTKQKDYLERIHDSGQHLLELINDILDLSRLEAGRMELDLQAVYIADICEAVTSLIQERASSQGLSLEVDLDPNVEWIVADPRRLKQMLLNLLTNAIKFTPQGTVGLKVYCDSYTLTPPFAEAHTAEAHTLAEFAHTSLANLKLIHFLVWDTGIGMTEADQRSLFLPFSQIDSSLTRKHQGTGLGLVITQKLAELHGGWVRLKSTPGKGSKFTITLPLRAAG
ncbi:MAG: PAS domain S-box protein [Leptolyngbyaceae cyanobacterium bins.349]|nr:PAS domain S-box protein [Leptolyngbyaceae cyanobacterium bins.349]